MHVTITLFPYIPEWRGVLYMGIKIYNSLPTYVKKESINTKKFESLLKNFLCENSF